VKDARASQPPEEPPVKRELQDLVARAKQGDATALPRLRALLDAHPEVWQTVGNLARYVEAAWIDLVAGDDPLFRESMKRQAGALREALSGPHATKSEALLVDLVVNNWLGVQQAEYSQATQTGGGGSIMQANHRLRRSESAQRKFLMAMRMLTTLRAAVPEGLAPINCLRLCGEEERESA
jgi:hypothetical protein